MGGNVLTSPIRSGPGAALSAAARLVASLPFTAYVLLVLLVSLPPLWTMLLLLPAGRLPHRLLRRWARVVIRSSGCRFLVTGLDHLRSCEAAVLVSNHASYIDSIVLMATVPLHYHFVADAKHATWPFVGIALRKARHLMVDRSTAAKRVECARAMATELERGTSLLVFPEGTRGRGPELLPFQLGAFRTAVKVGRPVIPIAVRGTRRVWPSGAMLLRRGSIEVVIPQPIEPEGHGRREMMRVRDRARLEIARSLEGEVRPVV